MDMFYRNGSEWSFEGTAVAPYPEGSLGDFRAEMCRWEALRRLLGHELCLGVEEIGELFADLDPETDVDDEVVVNVLVAYATRLRVMRATRHASLSKEGQGLPAPVLPIVNLVGLVASHETCTGNSRYSLTPCRGVSGWRNEEAPERGTLGWQAARALLGRTTWSGGGGAIALQLAKSELEREGIDDGLIKLVVMEEGFCREAGPDSPDLLERLAAQEAAIAAAG
jgi:hypothetical protein